MLREKKMGINAILNVLRQCLSIIFPIITYPYALRTLGVTNIGKVNYTGSIIGYFSLIAMLGVSNYAIREGAKRKGNKEKFEKFVAEIFTINIISTVISYILLIITLAFAKNLKSYAILLLIQSATILFNTLKVDWINNVFEDFFYITVRSIIIYFITIIFLFVFIRNENDYYLYALMSVVTNAIISMMNWVYCKKYVHIKMTLHPNIRLHLKPIMTLFANAIAISIYVNIDTTMLGWIQGDYSVGIYSTAVKIYSIVKNILVSIYAVAVPRLSLYVGTNDWKTYKKINSKLWGIMSLLLVPAGIGLISLSDEIMLIMGGKEFADSAVVLQILSIALIFAIFGGLVTACMNITLSREKYTLNATILGAALNLGLNFLMIPLFAQNGAAITTVLAEAVVFMFSFISIPNKDKYLDFKKIRQSFLNSCIGGAIIVIVTVLLKGCIINSFIRIILIIISSITLYGIVLVIRQDIYFSGLIRPLMRKIKKVGREAEDEK